MPIKVYKPTSQARRGMSVSTFEEITSTEPERSLLVALKRHSGRNARGVVTVRHQGGGEKRKYRLIDFRREKEGIPARVESIQYDPNRTARIALLNYADGAKGYILAPVGVQVGDTRMSGEAAEIRPGNAMALERIPLGTQIHNIELEPGRGAQLARSAGASAQLLAKEGRYAQVRLPSGEVRLVHVHCMATIGQVGNIDHGNIRLGKAGRTRHLGKRPEVRGAVMSPRAHPHGGGEAKNPIGLPGPKTPWGKPTLGYKTRKRKITNKMIVRGRPRKGQK